MHALTIVVPCKTQTESNANGMPFVRAKRAKDQRWATFVAMNANRLDLMELRSWPRWKITMTRVAGGTLDDDNLPSAMKHIRDEIAKELRVGAVIKSGKRAGQFRENDDDPRLVFAYEQIRTGGQYATTCVQVRFELPNG